MTASREERMSGTEAPGDRPPRYGLWAILVAVAALAVSAAVVTWEWRVLRRSAWEERPLEGLQVFWTVPDFSLTERSGRTVTLENLRGKVWVASFIYTECKETCPLQTAHMAQLERDLAAERDLRFVSITVDPKHDSPEVLREYAKRYGADAERWFFLTGEKRAIYDLALKGFRLSVADPEDQDQGAGLWPFAPRPAYASHGSKGLVIHSSRLVLVDRQARVRGLYPGTEQPAIERLRKDTRILLREPS